MRTVDTDHDNASQLLTVDHPTSSNNNIPSTERQALQDLYESTDGAHWNYSSSSSAGTHWSFDDHEVNPCLDQVNQFQKVLTV